MTAPTTAQAQGQLTPNRNSRQRGPLTRFDPTLQPSASQLEQQWATWAPMQAETTGPRQPLTRSTSLPTATPGYDLRGEAMRNLAMQGSCLSASTLDLPPPNSL
jgi:hypothetical protein